MTFTLFQYFGIKTFPVRDMKRRYFKKKIAQLFAVLERPQWLLYGTLELHCGRIDFSLGSSMLFFLHDAFLSNRATDFFINNKCFVLYSLDSQKQLV